MWQTLGLACGIFFLIMIVGFGIGAILAASPVLFQVCRFLGCAYLVWLGVSLLRSKARAMEMTAAPDSDMTAISLWWRGFLVNATNPKGVIFFLSLLTPFLDPGKSILLQYVQMGLTCGFTDVCVMTGVTLAADFVAKQIRSTRTMRLVNIVFGTCFIAMGLGLMVFNGTTL